MPALEILVKLRDEASKQLKDFNKNIEASKKQLNDMAKTAGIVGGTITAVFGLSVKAAEEERQSQMRLAMAIQNTGMNYDAVKTSVESVIEATMRKTGVSDDQQRAALSELVLATGNYQQALDLLPLALDLAAAKQMDVEQAGLLVGKMATGIIPDLDRYGIKLDENASSADNLALLQDKVKGSAEAMKSPFDDLNNSFDTLKEKLGEAVMPMLKNLMEKLIPIVEKVIQWVKENPKLVNAIAAFGAALLALAIVLKVVAIGLTLVQALSGPAGWITLAAGLALAGATYFAVSKMMETSGMPAGAKTPEETAAEKERDRFDREIAWWRANADKYQPGIAEGNIAALEKQKAALPSYQYGGTVPGPFGKPVPVIAHGGEVFAGAGRGLGNTYVTVNVAGSVQAERDLAQTIRRELLLLQNRNVSTGLV